MSESESSSNKGLDFSSVAAAGASYQIKLFEIAQANMQLAFEYAQALTAVRSSGELFGVTSEYAKKRMDMFNSTQRNWLNSYLPNFVVRQNRSKVGSRWRVFANRKGMLPTARSPSVICISEQRATASKVCYRE